MSEPTQPVAGKLGLVGIPAGVILIVALMTVPLPTAVLDLLIACNMTLAMLILLVSMHVRRPLDFAVFPSLLLIATLARLALNISATRLVLLHGFAGKVIESFGHFVVGGSLVVGIVIFVILVVIQFLVITKGAERVAEVGARFTLDALPGKQMAIDADLNSGLIDEAGARIRRADVSAEADFYGAMDGASKFVKGDAIAAIVITVVNLVGGLLVGVVQNHLPIAEAVQRYSLLSIGDGLVSQVPALLLSISTGLIITRSATAGDMGSDIITQFGRQAPALRIAGGAILALGLVPGMPKVPFALAGAGALFIASRAAKRTKSAAVVVPETVQPTVNPDAPESIAMDMRVEPLELAVAVDLVDLVDTTVGGDLLDRVRSLRRSLAMEMGLVIPLVRTRDDIDLPAGTYVIRLNGVETARSSAPRGTVLAIGDNLTGLAGTATREPVFGLPAMWVPQELRHQAELMGATVVDRASLITTHLAEVVRRNASRLLGREDVKALLDVVRRTHPVVVEDLTPGLLSLGEIQRVLQALLDESVPIRDLVRIAEALSIRAKSGADPEGLVESVRAVLGPAISAPYASDGVLTVLSVDPSLEQTFLEQLRTGDRGTFLALNSGDAERFALEARRMAEQVEQSNRVPVLACSAPLRVAIHKLVRVAAPRLPVISYAELGTGLKLDSVGVVGLHAMAA